MSQGQAMQIRDRRGSAQTELKENQMMEVPAWPMRSIEGVSKSLGVSSQGYEERLMQLFGEIVSNIGIGKLVLQPRWKESKGEISVRRQRRELRKLICTVKYDEKREWKKKGDGAEEELMIIGNG
ncbi:hypothetical protein F0562_016864 [Nyssa sinensis]|uniref:Uncharacterized protein n=1 Tax=Nyssa sinensis TaxID=561372 RepID=A0A5J4ZH22_9ASTE|nr:hypothetical protein F0562_016864 [Nyssa sinensis]